MSEETTQEEQAPRFKCAECGQAVIVFEGEVHRICGHSEAGVTAECSAICYGDASMLGD